MSNFKEKESWLKRIVFPTRDRSFALRLWKCKYSYLLMRKKRATCNALRRSIYRDTSDEVPTLTIRDKNWNLLTPISEYCCAWLIDHNSILLSLSNLLDFGLNESHTLFPKIPRKIYLCKAKDFTTYRCDRPGMSSVCGLSMRRNMYPRQPLHV